MSVPSTYSRIISSVLLLMLAVFCGAGCDDDNNTTGSNVPPKLLTSPSTLLLSDTKPLDTFFMSLDAPGQITWKVTAHPDWATVNPMQGVATQDFHEILVAADSSGLGIGTHRGYIEIISTGGEEMVALVFDIALHPQVELSATNLDFGSSENQASLIIHSVGNGTLSWSIASQDSWCQVAYPTSGWMNPGDSAVVDVTVDRGGLDAGPMQTTLTITSNADSGDVTIPVSMQVPATAILTIADTAAIFGYLSDSITLSLHNQGNVATDYTLSFSDNVLSGSGLAGMLARSDSVDIVLYVDKSSLPSDTLPAQFEMYIAGTSGNSDTIPIFVYNYQPDLTYLDYRLVDAEYCRATDMLVAVSTDPSQFHLIDPATETIQTIDLALPPNCVAVQPDGAFAIVGHNALVTYIDLTTLQVEHTWSVSADAIDIILPGHDWAYVFPRTDQWTSAHCIELATGLDITHVGGSIRAGTLVRLHPSGDYIYGADNGLSPSDFEKYDIRSDTMKMMYDSPYHGDYAFSGNLWISDDGAFLFARSSNIFTSSETRSLDMLYAGNFAGVSLLQWAEHSSAAGRVYVVGGGGSWYDPTPTELYVYDDEYFAYKGKVGLPKFVKPNSGSGELVSCMPRFAFISGDGSTCYVLATGETGSGLDNTWAVITVLTAEQP